MDIYIVTIVGMIGIWLGLFVAHGYSPCIFLSFPMLDPPAKRFAHLAALHFRLGAPTLGPRRSMEIPQQIAIENGHGNSGFTH